jgi:hypothetical protein
VRKFRSPWLSQYNKDYTNPTNGTHLKKEWVHELKAGEAPFKNNTNSPASRPYQAGDFLDYELSSGDLTNAQKAAGRAAIGVFFNTSLSSGPRPVNITETPGELDSGCGDDNDPINDLGEDLLILNNGTDTLDVQNYDIKITFDPTKINAQDSISATTIVNAIAAEDLNAIELDFRQQALTAEPTVWNVTDGSAVGVTSVERINQDELDKQKIILHLDATIKADEAFDVTFNYTTGTIDSFVNDEPRKSPQGFSKSLNGIGVTAIGEPFGATYWFPNNNTPRDGATYTISLTYPRTGGYVGVSNGVRISDANSGTASKTTVWKVSQPTATYQIFASINNDYTAKVQTSTAANNADGAYTSIDGRRIPSYLYYSTTQYNANANRNRDRIDNFYGNQFNYIRELEKILGPYQGEALHLQCLEFMLATRTSSRFLRTG